MSLTVKHLKLRLAAGLLLALAGNSSAATSLADRNVLKFTPASAIMRPQTQKKSNIDYSSDDGVTVKIPIRLGPPLTTPAPTTTTTETATTMISPRASAPVSPAPVSAPPVSSAPVSQGTSPLSNSPVTLAPRQPIAEPDRQTTAGYKALSRMPACPECEKAAANRNSMVAQADQLTDLRDKIDDSTGHADLKNRLAIAAVNEAVATRAVTPHCGGGWRSGNRSKCACAGGVKDALKDSGACPIRIAGYVNAVNLAGLPNGSTDQLSRTGPHPSSALPAYCPAFHQTKGRFANLNAGWEAVKNAPPGSVIVYSTSRHKWGHVETKVQVTEENYAQISRKLRVRIGEVLYCSDFCTPSPNFSHGTNRVEAIYSL